MKINNKSQGEKIDFGIKSNEKNHKVSTTVPAKMFIVSEFYILRVFYFSLGAKKKFFKSVPNLLRDT